jgi:hypothetical protein
VLKWIALVISILACGLYDFVLQRKLADRRVEIKMKEQELQPLKALDAEVRVYERKKDWLQRHIDVINRLKQSQVVPADAVAILAAAENEPAAIDSVAIAGPHEVVINGHATADSEIDQLATGVGAKEKHVAPDHSFSLRVTP